jgi:hypothetical protein
MAYCFHSVKNESIDKHTYFVIKTQQNPGNNVLLIAMLSMADHGGEPKIQHTANIWRCGTDILHNMRHGRYLITLIDSNMQFSVTKARKKLKKK